jgi:hypothetical protein
MQKHNNKTEEIALNKTGRICTSEATIDSTTQFLIYVALGILAIVIGAAVAVAIYLKQRSRKSLSYKEQTVTQLRVKSEMKEKLKITYDGKEVVEVYLTVIELFNSGNVPILKTDFEEPIKLSFGKDAQVLTTEIFRVEPKNLQVSITSDGNTITLAPALINPKESITIKSLVNKLDEVCINGRIVGIKVIEKAEIKLRLKLLFTMFVAFYFISFLGAVLSAFVNATLSSIFVVSYVATTFAVMVLGILILAVLIRNWLQRKE